MFMKVYTSYLSLLVFLLCLSANIQAQNNIVKSLENNNTPGGGRVNVYQDSRFEALLGTCLSASEDGSMRMAGYRVQVYAGGNSRNSKREAESMAARVRSEFPDLRVYTTFTPPRWLCRVGDFLSMEEADNMMRKLRKEGGFREVTIVKEQVTITF